MLVVGSDWESTGQQGAGSLGERSQHEFPLGDAYMRDYEALVVDLAVLVHEDIQIDIPRALVYDLLAPEGILNGLECIQKRQGLQGCFYLGNMLAKRVTDNQRQPGRAGRCWWQE